MSCKTAVYVPRINHIASIRPDDKSPQETIAIPMLRIVRNKTTCPAASNPMPNPKGPLNESRVLRIDSCIPSLKAALRAPAVIHCHTCYGHVARISSGLGSVYLYLSLSATL